jgi:hypothetical protein
LGRGDSDMGLLNQKKLAPMSGTTDSGELACRPGILLGGGLKHRRNFVGCKHGSTITTITAGLAREVCESCSRVRIRYVGGAVRLRPDRSEEQIIDIELEEAIGDVLSQESEHRYLKCGLCTQPAVFMIPDGLTCDEHAWQAAARLTWEDVDPWVPIRIDRSNASG